MIDRREVLRLLGGLSLTLAGCSRASSRSSEVSEATGATGAIGASESNESSRALPAPNRTTSGNMPVIFAAHGAPMLLDDAVWMAELAAWAKVLPRPKAVVVVSAHWAERPVTLGATTVVPLVYDFYGFPERFYQTKYAPPAASEVANHVRELLRQKSIPFLDDPTRGLDHGAYIPLLALYPKADVPVLQVSMPGLDPKSLFELGQALVPLREEGVLIFGSGFLTHNMAYGGKSGTPAWAREFDEWARDALQRFDVDALLDFRARSPAARLALPTWEHYGPVLVAAGASSEVRPEVTFPITGWWMDGAFTKRSIQFA